MVSERVLVLCAHKSYGTSEENQTEKAFLPSVFALHSYSVFPGPISYGMGWFGTARFDTITSEMARVPAADSGTALFLNKWYIWKSISKTRWKFLIISWLSKLQTKLQLRHSVSLLFLCCYLCSSLVHCSFIIPDSIRNQRQLLRKDTTYIKKNGFIVQSNFWVKVATLCLHKKSRCKGSHDLNTDQLYSSFFPYVWEVCSHFP